MHLRLHKKFRIFKWLHVTVSKTGVSVGVHLGPFSRNWGTRQNSTYIDGPGHFGLGWEQKTVHGHHDEDEHTGFHWLGWPVLMVQTAVGVIRTYVHPLHHCELHGSPVVALIAIYGGSAVLYWISGRWRFGGAFFLLLLIGGSWLQWQLYGHWVSPHVLCGHAASR